ncbi:MFS family permease [Nocardia sp. GAS34]
MSSRSAAWFDPRLFARRSFSGAMLMALIGMAAAGGYLWVMTFYLQDARGRSAAAAGVFLLPVAVMVFLAAPLSGRLTARFGPRIPLTVSGFGIATGAALLVDLAGGTPGWRLIASFVLFGLGFGMLNAPITATAVAGMPAERAGVASAIASTGRQIGQALGVAIVGAIVVPGIGANVPATLPGASGPGWAAIAVGGLLVVALASAATERYRGTGSRGRSAVGNQGSSGSGALSSTPPTGSSTPLPRTRSSCGR